MRRLRKRPVNADLPHHHAIRLRPGRGHQPAYRLVHRWLFSMGDLDGARETNRQQVLPRFLRIPVNLKGRAFLLKNAGAALRLFFSQ